MTRFRQLAVPLLAITVGIGWLLQRPRSGVPRRLALDALAGIVGTLDAVHRLNRLTCVVGPFLLMTSVTSILRQTRRLTLDVEVPVLVVAFGVLLLVAQLSRLPPPEWLILESDKHE